MQILLRLFWTMHVVCPSIYTAHMEQIRAIISHLSHQQILYTTKLYTTWTSTIYKCHGS